MNVICNGCSSRLSWNHKTDRKLASLSCPHCGGRYRIDRTRLAPDPNARAEYLIQRAELVAHRLERSLRELVNIGPNLADLGRLLADLQRVKLLNGGEA